MIFSGSGREEQREGFGRSRARLDAEKTVSCEELVVLLQCTGADSSCCGSYSPPWSVGSSTGTLQAMSSIIMCFPPQSVFTLPVAVNHIRGSHG